MARDMIVLEGNVGELAVPLRVLFLYRGLPAVTDDAGTAVVLTPQDEFTDEDKELLQSDELNELDDGTLAAEVVVMEKPAGVADVAALREYVTHLQRFYRIYKERFLLREQNTHSLRGLVIDAIAPGGGINGVR